MADDINLPNLVSHLAVNLDGLSGSIADAQRQGSSMGAALGDGIRRELRDTVAHLPDIQVDGDTSDLDRDLARVRRELDQLANQRIGVDVSIADALRQLEELEPHLQRLSDTHPNINVQATTRGALRQLEQLRAAARQVDDEDVTVHVNVDEDRVRRFHGVLGKLGSMAGSIGGVAASFGKVSAALGTAIPAAAGLVSTLANVAPAAGVAVTGLLQVGLAVGTVKMATAGMGDALSAALDPEKAEDFSEALEKLSPEARKFAQAVKSAQPALHKMQQSVQNEFFKGLGDELERTGKSVLPVLRTNLLSSATALNQMAKGAMGAARELASSGTLGKALGSASKGLHNMSGIPGVIVQGLGQIGAAAGPSFERLTKAGGRAAERLGDRMNKAFESGRMQAAIERAIDLLGQLGDIAGNIGRIIGQVFNAVPSDGGMLGVLKDVTAEIAKVVGSPEVQSGLRSLFETMGTLGKTVAPLLGQALLTLAPVLTALGPPVQTVIRALGAGLQPIIKALSPVLQTAAVAVGKLLTALAPLLPVAGQLVASILPALTPLLSAVGDVFAEAAPVVALLGESLQQILAPILAQLPAIVAPFVSLLQRMSQTLFPLLTELIVALTPTLVTLSSAFAELLVAAAPLLTVVAQLALSLLQALMPILTPLIGLIGKLAEIFAGGLSGVLTGIVVPALTIVTQLLQGDFSGAWETAKGAVSQARDVIGRAAGQLGVTIGKGVNDAITWLKGMPGRGATALSGLAGALGGKASQAGVQLVATISKKINDAVTWVKGLPGRAKAALGDLSGVLAAAGRSLISGFINGIASKFGDVRSKLGSLTSSLTDWKGPPKKDAKILTPAGRLLISGFIKGIDESTAKLRSRLQSITKALPANVRSGIGKSLARATAELGRQVSKRDAVLKKLAAAQKKLDGLVKDRAKVAGDIKSGILGEADITKGFADVNSVTAITVGLQVALKKTKQFQADIAKLRKAGLRSDLLQQIADAGVEGGAATATALARATPAELKKINDLQAQLAKSATATGNTVGDALYGAGINAAKGLVAGLKSQEKAIEKQMRKIAEAMLKTVKKVHKTKSPSRAFWDIGVMDGEGLRGGFLAMADKVRAAARQVANAALDVATGAPTFAVPTGPQLATAYAGTGGGGDTYHTWNLSGGDATPGGILNALSWHGLVGRR